MQHPFIAKCSGDERCMRILLSEKNGTVDVVEEIESSEDTASLAPASTPTPTAPSAQQQQQQQAAVAPTLASNKESQLAVNVSLDSSAPTSSSSAHGGGGGTESDLDASFDHHANNSAPCQPGGGGGAQVVVQVAAAATSSPTRQLVNKSEEPSSSNNNINNNNKTSPPNKTSSSTVPATNGSKFVKPLAPPPPPSSSSSSQTQNQNKSKRVDHDQLELLLELVASDIFEDMCDEVIKCDDRAPSVPDVILQVISELLAESSTSSFAQQQQQARTAASQPPPQRTHRHTSSSSSPLSSSSSSASTSSSNSSCTKNANINTNRISTVPAAPAVPASGSSDVSISVLGNAASSSGSSSSKSSTNKLQPQVSQTPTGAAAAAAAAAAGSISLQKLSRNRTRKTITRTFVVDGQTMTHTPAKTVIPEEEERARQRAEDRKRDLIEHKRHLNEDRRKLVEQTRKQEAERDSLEIEFKEQRDKLLKEFDAKLANVATYRKQEMERCVEAQAAELKLSMKRMRAEQEKQVKCEREALKDEFKVFKRELESSASRDLVAMSREKREALKKHKEREIIKREEEFQLAQLAELADEERRIGKLHRQQLAHADASAVLERHNLVRTREAAVWELERLQMEQRCNVIRKHVRDFFYLQRHLMLGKQEKDLDHLSLLNAKLEEDLVRRQADEKRLFLKSLRQEQRSRREMYKRSLYIVPASGEAPPTAKMSADEEKRKLKDFDEKEKERFEAEQQRLAIRHVKQLDEYRSKADGIMKDLDDEQRMKRRQLVEAETKCLRDVDERYSQEYEYWQNKLRSRKQVCVFDLIYLF